MRTTIIIPDDVIGEYRRLAGDIPLSRFVREAVRERLNRLKEKSLALEMAAGYQAEAETPSLDPEWYDIETEGL